MGFILFPVSKVFAVMPPGLGLGTADSYAVFGAAGVTNTGASTHIWGDVGADSSVTGLDDATQVDGTIKFAPATNGVATDASSTYDSLMDASQGDPSDLDLAGTNTIVPGVYNVAATTFNGALTLNGAGVYIFRSSSSNTTVGSGTMNLINGACASNVFWAISASMTIGTGADVEGTIIAQTGLISLATGATLVGRAISLTKQVTLQSNQITQPTCAVATPTPTSTPTTAPGPTSTPGSSPTPTPTTAPGPTSTPGSSPTPTVLGPTLTPGLSPTPTPTPTVLSTSTSNLTTSNGVETKYCESINGQIITPAIIESKRIDADSIFIKWGPYSGIDKFNVEYGFEKEKLLYNTDVTGFSTIINALHSNQPIWVRVAARDDCQVGTYGEPKLVGGPGLPSTGMFPNDNNFLKYAFMGSAILLVFLLKKVHS